MADAGKKCEQAHCIRTRVTGSVLSEVQNSWNQRRVPWSVLPPPEAHSISSTSGCPAATRAITSHVAHTWSTHTLAWRSGPNVGDPGSVTGRLASHFT